ncbi:MAG TPA: hypothetical protein PKD91_04495 [Bacteroidia bacterium]|nr:hypothetical protein [Bacteroidia bacterium]
MKTNHNLLSPKENQSLCYFKKVFTDKNQLLKIHVWFLILFCCCTFYSNAQAPLDAAVSFSGNQGYFKVMVPDTNDVSEIEMLVGTDDNASEMFSHIFTYDQVSGLPSGLSYSRTGNEINVGMGTVTLLNAYNAKVRLKNGSNSWSDWYEFIGN